VRVYGICTGKLSDCCQVCQVILASFSGKECTVLTVHWYNIIYLTVARSQQAILASYARNMEYWYTVYWSEYVSYSSCQTLKSFFGKFHRKHGVCTVSYTVYWSNYRIFTRSWKVISASFTGNMVYVQCRTLFTGPIIAFLPGPGKLFRQVSRKKRMYSHCVPVRFSDCLLGPGMVFKLVSLNKIQPI
jgi:hypothetical protein